MIIRRLSKAMAPSYAPEIVSIYRQVRPATYASPELGISEADIMAEFGEFDQQVSVWREKILNDSHRAFWLAQTSAGLPIGFSGARKDGADHELELTFVLPEYQGRGIGKRLLEQAFSWLGDEEPIHLEVATHNSRAIELYRHQGFELSAEPTQPYTLKSGKQIPWTSMYRPSRRFADR